MNSFQPSQKPPIPQPSHPLQYRAIGLVKAQYQASQSKIHQGYLIDSQKKSIRTVVLGKALGLLKSNLDLNQEYFWVVYPRTKSTTGELSLQIAGVWQPDTPEDQNIWEDRYFSIRGEVIKINRKQRFVLLKIQRNSSTQSQKNSFFTLKLFGNLPNNTEGHFWDLQVKLQNNLELVIKTGKNLGEVVKKPPAKPIPKSSVTSSSEKLFPKIDVTKLRRKRSSGNSSDL